jgi:hypothetical protein
MNQKRMPDSATRPYSMTPIALSSLFQFHLPPSRLNEKGNAMSRIISALAVWLIVSVSAASAGAPLIQVDGNDVTTTTLRHPNDRPAELSMFTSFPDGSIYYTLDGTEPTFASTRYTGKVLLAANSTIRAVAYSLDFSQSPMSGPVAIEFVPLVEFNFLTPGPEIVRGERSPAPDRVNPEPPYTQYMSNTVITLKATPQPGWTFMRWLYYDEISTANPISIVITNQLWVEVIVGTTVNIVSVNHGRIQSEKNGLIEYDGVVELLAIPDDDYYFASWGGSLSGRENPKGLMILSPTPSVSALFLPLPRILMDGNFGFQEGKFGFSISGSGSQQVRIEALDDLNRTDWTALGTVILNQGSGFFADPQADTSKPRFYRLALLQP